MHDPVQAIIETNSNVEGVVMTKVYSNKEKKSVTSMRDFDAADLEKFPGVASNFFNGKKKRFEITNNFGPKSNETNRRQIEVESRHRRQRKGLLKRN